MKQLKISLVTVCVIFCFSCNAQTDSTARKSLSPEAAAYLESVKDSMDISEPRMVFHIGYSAVYQGEDAIGNELMKYALTFKKQLYGDDYHELSVQNTKNGNYLEAISALETAVQMDPTVNGYYGWVLLYYYHDYERALAALEKFDALTPGFSDAPVGEDIHFLKGLCYMQMKKYSEAIEKFDIYINETTKSHGEDWVDLYTYVYKGICLHRLGMFNEAVADYDKTIKYYKDCTEAYYYRAIAKFALDESAEACENLRKAHELALGRNLHYDVYVEMFEAVYIQDIETDLKLYGCR